MITPLLAFKICALAYSITLMFPYEPCAYVGNECITGEDWMNLDINTLGK